MIMRIKGATSRVKHFKLKLIIAVIVIISCTATTVFAASSVVTTYVYCEDEISRVVSISTDPDDIIRRASIELTDDDVVDLDGYTEGKNDGVIYVHKAHNVVISDDGEKSYVYAAGTVKDALKKAGIKLSLGDKISVSKDVFLTEGMVIKINRAFGVTVIADGDSQSFEVTKGNVADILAQAKVTLNKHDVVSHGLDELLEEGMKIVVKRISYKTRTTTESIAFKTVTERTSELYNDQKEVVTKGVNGQSETVYKDKYVDGVLESSVVKSETVIKEPVNQVVKVGTKNRPLANIRPTSTSRVISRLTPPSPIELDENGRPVHYKRVITGKATAYCTGTICSTGVPPMPGRVAVNPRQIPYGTKMYIVSSDGKYVYGYSVAADTGGFTWNGSGTLIDLYMYSYSECVNFGRRTVEVYIL